MLWSICSKLNFSTTTNVVCAGHVNKPQSITKVAAAYPDEQVKVEHDDQTVDICNERPSDVAPEIIIENLR